MKYLFTSLLICLFLSACKEKSSQSLLQTFNRLADSSSEIKVTLIPSQFETESVGIALSSSEIRSLREYLKDCVQIEPCGQPEAQISFYRVNRKMGIIDFGLATKCKVLYLHSDGKVKSFQMGYRIGTFLDDVLRELARSNAKPPSS